MGCYKKLRESVKLKFNNTCCICGITTWQNKPITLQVDHIDGNNKNNDLTNLRLLCPNCHSQTDTFTFKKTQSTFSNKLKQYLMEMSQEQVKQFFQLNSFEEICKITGTSMRSVRKYLKDNSHIKPKWKVHRERKFQISANELKQKLVDQKIPVSVIAKNFSVSHAAVRKLAKKYKIKIPLFFAK